MAKKTFEIEINGLDKIAKESNQTVTTMNQLKKTLKELKKEAGDMDVASEEFAAISQEINNITKQLKALEKQQGTTSRNVGNYADEIKEAFKDINKDVKEVAENIKKVNDTPFEIQIDDVTYKFENLSQALGEIDDKAQGLSAQMMALKDAGQANTEEYANLQAQFEKYVGKAAELEKARKFSDEIKDSLSQQNRTLTLAVDGFQALGNSLQIASGFAGLFGKNQDEIEKSINRTVQIMAILQASQELYNLYLKNSTVLIKAWNIALLTTDKVMKAVGISTTGVSTAMKSLRAAIASTGIGALVVAIGMAVSYLFDFVEGLINAKSEEEKQADAIDRLAKSYSNYYNQLKNINDLDVKLGLLTESEAAKKLVNEAQSELKQFRQYFSDEKYSSFGSIWGDIKNVDLTNIKELRNIAAGLASEYAQLETTISNYGNEESKVTDLDYANAVAKKQLYDLVIQLLNANNDYNDSLKKEQEEQERISKEYNDKLKEANDELANYRIQSMEDGLEKQKAILYEEQRQQLNAVRERGVKVQELEKAIREETNRKLLALDEEYRKKREDLLNEINQRYGENSYEAKNTQLDLSKFDAEKKLSNISDEIIKINFEFSNLRYTLFDKKAYNEGITNLKDYLNQYYRYVSEYKQKLNNKFLSKNTDLGTIIDLETKYAEGLRKITNEKDLVNYQQNNEVLNQLLKNYKDTAAGIIGDIYQIEIDQLKQAKAKKISELLKKYKEEQKLLRDSLNDNLITEEEYNNNVKKLNENFNLELNNINKKYNQDAQEIDKKAYEKRSAIAKTYYDALYTFISTSLDKIKQEEEKYSNPIMTGNYFVDALGNLSRDVFKKNNFSGIYTDFLEEINAAKQQLDTDLKNGVISQEVYQISYENLLKLEEQTQTSLASLEGDWRSWTQKVTSVVSNFSSQIFDLFSQGFQVSFDNQQRELEKQQELLDAETEAIEKALSKQEEIYQAHADKVISIEDELATARGERRQFLIEQLAEETKKQQEAYAAQQKLEKQKEQQEAKSQALEAQQEALEKQRNITNQKIQIAQALANTALGVTNALTVQPFFLGLALASLVGAMGAAQVGIIAAQKFADGGIIKGPSHENGGVKVLGGTAEVEGGEYIVNKQTTSNNADLLNYINSQKRSLTAADLNYYFNQKQSTYAMPTSSIQSLNSPSMVAKSLNQVIMNDTRPIVVSVEEIDRVSNNVRNVKALAGL